MERTNFHTWNTEVGTVLLSCCTYTESEFMMVNRAQWLHTTWQLGVSSSKAATDLLKRFEKELTPQKEDLKILV